MKLEFKHKIISIVLLLCLVFPLGIGLSHIFHHHDDSSCNAKNESHIHEDSLDCDHLHYFNKTNSFSSVNSDDSDAVRHVERSFSVLSFQVYFTTPKNLSDRAPPIILVL